MKLKDIMIDFPEVKDERGCLSIAEGIALPFEVKRVFWIYDICEGKTRGGHAHVSCEEVVVAVSGSFDMFVDDGKDSREIKMDSPSKGIYIKKGVWCELRNFAPGTICVVLASEAYDSEGYINDYKEFCRFVDKVS